jgi:hypothetical protein
VLVAMLARARTRQGGGVLLPTVAADLLLLVAFLRALASRRVSWRGTTLAARGSAIVLAEERR